MHAAPPLAVPAAGTSLLCHPEISWFARTMVMSGIIITAALFAAVANCIGAKVYITLTVGSETFRPPSVFNFGMAPASPRAP